MKNVPVDEYSTPCPITVDPEATVEDVSTLMKDENIRHIPVVVENRPVGIISDRDIKLALSFNHSKTVMAKDVMTREPFIVAPDSPLHEVALEMSSKKIGSALVLDENEEIVGIFTSTDSLNALVELLRESN